MIPDSLAVLKDGNDSNDATIYYLLIIEQRTKQQMLLPLRTKPSHAGRVGLRT